MARKSIPIVNVRGLDNLPGIMTQDELDQKIRELEQKVKGTTPPKPKKDVPQASPELWPGGPSEDTGDIRLA